MSEVDDEEEEDDMNDEDGSEDDDDDEDEDEDSDEDDDDDDDEEEVTPTKKKSKGRSKGSKKKQTSRKLWSKSVSSLSTTFHPFFLGFLCFINPSLSGADLTLFSLRYCLNKYRCFYKRAEVSVRRFAFCKHIYWCAVAH